jgi:hypothetical protein
MLTLGNDSIGIHAQKQKNNDEEYKQQRAMEAFHKYL